MYKEHGRVLWFYSFAVGSPLTPRSQNAINEGVITNIQLKLNNYFHHKKYKYH